MRRRPGFTLVEVLVAITILGGVVLGMAEFTRRYQRSATDSASLARASDVASAQLETVKAWRDYSTLVATFHNNSVTFATGDTYAGLTRQTLAVRTGPDATTDHITVTVVVSGSGLSSAVRRTTVIAAF